MIGQAPAKLVKDVDRPCPGAKDAQEQQRKTDGDPTHHGVEMSDV